MRQFLPETLAIPVVLSDQHFLDELVDDMGPGDLGRAEAVPGMAILGMDADHRLMNRMFGARMAVARAVGMAAGHVPEYGYGHVVDDHGLSPPSFGR